MSEPNVPTEVAATADTLHAISNAAKLAGSLVGTWGIALVVRFYMPRHLGPDRFGAFTYADSLTATCAVLLSLGIDTHIRAKVSVKPEIASNFFGSLLALRLAIAAATVAFLFGLMAIDHRSTEMHVTVFVLALYQLMLTLNNSFTALLHAVGKVDGLSVLSVVMKVVWALGTVVGLIAGVPLWALALAYLVTEALRSAVLFGLCRSHLGLVLRMDWPAAREALLASLPFFIGSAATIAYSRLDANLLAAFVGEKEVGYYGAATTVASLSMLLSPMLGWVLMPLLSRAAARSPEEFAQKLLSATGFLIGLAFPVSLFLFIAADDLVRLLLGPAFQPSAAALRMQAWTFVLTYAAMISASALIALDKGWTSTWISVAGLVVNAGLNLIMIRPVMHWLGDAPGSGGIACSAVALFTEVVVVVLMTNATGIVIAGRRSLVQFGKALALSALILGLDRVLTPLGLVRFPIEGACYVALAWLSGAIEVGLMLDLFRRALRRRAGKALLRGPLE